MKGGVEVAQLIKLQDYITRYEWDTFRYPTQYIRLKKENWDRLYEKWSQPEEKSSEQFIQDQEQESGGLLSKLKDKLLKRSVYSETIIESVEEENELPSTEKELKQQFLDHLLNFQLKWATSTVNHQSIIDKKYKDDPLLKYLLQRFPDTYLLMYHPVFTIKQAPIEADIIFISPIEIEIIHFVELEESAVLMAGEERTWHVESPDENRKILNPLISLKRTEKVIRSILSVKELSFPVKKTIISRTNPIMFSSEPYQTRIVDKMSFDSWFLGKRQLNSPLKNDQIKVAEALLGYCQSISIRRPEWEDVPEESPHITEEMEEY